MLGNRSKISTYDGNNVSFGKRGNGRRSVNYINVFVLVMNVKFNSGEIEIESS